MLRPMGVRGFTLVHALRWNAWDEEEIACEQMMQIRIEKRRSKGHRDGASECVAMLTSAYGRRRFSYSDTTGMLSAK